MPRGRTRYPPEFRAEAVRLAREPGQSMRQVAGDLGIANESLRRWVIQADVDAGTEAARWGHSAGGAGHSNRGADPS